MQIEALWPTPIAMVKNDDQELHNLVKSATSYPEELKAFVSLHVQEFMAALGVVGGVESTREWCVDTVYGQENVPHIHPDADIAACYYAEAEAGAAPLRLFDTRGFSRLTAQLSFNQEGVATFGHNFTSILPVEGMLILLPASVLHGVPTQMTNAKRKVFVSNLKITQPKHL